MLPLHLITTIRQAMAGVPGIVPVGHFQKVAGMYRQDRRPLDLERIQCIRNLRKHCIVPVMSVYTELPAELSDDPARLLSGCAFYAATVSHDLQRRFRQRCAVLPYCCFKGLREGRIALRSHYFPGNIQH